MTLQEPGKAARSADAFAAFPSKTVYSNTTGDEVWGPEACGDLAIGPKGAYEGNAIRINWEKTPECDWVGMGIGWDGWQPKDLSGVLDQASLHFQFRSSQGESRLPIMVFLLEDYSGVMSAAPLRAGYMARYPLDTLWREVSLPLSDFPAKKDGLDLTNIKQLIIELQGSGDVMLDDMRIVRGTSTPNMDNRIGKPSIVAPSTMPLVLFEGQLPNSWGLERNECRDFALSAKGLELEWWDQCSWSRMGFSWSRWIGVDLNSWLKRSQLVVDAQWGEGQGKLLLGFGDYAGASSLLNLGQYPASADGLYRIPLADFDFEGRKVNAGNIKHFLLDAEGKGSALIRSIRLEESPQIR